MENIAFEATDLIWTKNVKRDQGNDWAYMEFHTGDTFYLNWPRGRADMGFTDAGKVKVNELIMLFQTVNSVTGSKKGTYLTHIVTPVEKTVVPDESSSHPYRRLVTVISKPTNPIPKPDYLNFFLPNRGWVCDLNLIKPFEKHNLTLTKQQKQVIFWDLFVDKDLEIKSFNTITSELSGSEQSDGSLEGEEIFLIGRHKYYERDPGIIRKKKEEAGLLGKLQCEVCSFDFERKFGLHGIGFIECHHIFPIAGNGKRKTTCDDLALVCSNCHRMLHRKSTNGAYPSLSELREIIT